VRGRDRDIERASDPVVAFAPDGTVYVSTLLVNLSACSDAVGAAVFHCNGLAARIVG